MHGSFSISANLGIYSISQFLYKHQLIQFCLIDAYIVYRRIVVVKVAIKSFVNVVGQDLRDDIDFS